MSKARWSITASIIGSVNDDLFRTDYRQNRRHVKRWTLEMSREWRLIWQLRERFERASAVSAENTEKLRLVFRRNEREFIFRNKRLRANESGPTHLNVGWRYW